MFVLYLGAMIILPLPISISLKYVAICVFTFIVCYFLYEFIIKRINIIRPLFGLKGKYYRKKKEVLPIMNPVEMD